jgi:hypothetical protein
VRLLIYLHACIYSYQKNITFFFIKHLKWGIKFSNLFRIMMLRVYNKTEERTSTWIICIVKFVLLLNLHFARDIFHADKHKIYWLQCNTLCTMSFRKEMEKKNTSHEIKWRKNEIKFQYSPAVSTFGDIMSVWRKFKCADNKAKNT